jgi:glycosyltransferase involved in cell wall biosynthesis
MTARNTARFVEPAVRSVLRSTHRDFELCIVDDGSTDGTTRILRRLAKRDDRIRLLVSARCGRLDALRQAHEMATGDVLAWVDSDDLVHQTALATCLAAIDDHHRLVYTHRRLIDETGRDHGPHQKNTIAYTPEQLLVSNMIFHLRTYTRDLYDQAGGLGELSSAIDWDMNLRMTEHTTPHVVPLELYSYRVRRGRMSGTPSQAANGRKAVEQAIARRHLNLELSVDRGTWTVQRSTGVRP